MTAVATVKGLGFHGEYAASVRQAAARAPSLELEFGRGSNDAISVDDLRARYTNAIALISDDSWLNLEDELLPLGTALPPIPPGTKVLSLEILEGGEAPEGYSVSDTRRYVKLVDPSLVAEVSALLSETPDVQRALGIPVILSAHQTWQAARTQELARTFAPQFALSLRDTLFVAKDES